VNANPTLVYTSTGLGINCNAPSYALDVTGTARASTGLIWGGNLLTGNGNTSTRMLGSYYSPAPFNSDFFITNNLTTFTSNSSNILTSTYDYDAGNCAIRLISPFQAAGAISFYAGARNTVPVNMMSVTPAGVGINCNIPTYTLDVNGTARATTLCGTWCNAATGATIYSVGNDLFMTGGWMYVENMWQLQPLNNAGTRVLGICFSNGNMGVNNTGPVYTLDVTGTIRATVDVTVTSDMRTKTNVETLSNALSKVNALRGVSYTSKADPSVQKIGVIAQEIEKVLPEVVMTDTSPEQTKSVTYGNITAVLIEAIKELTQRLESLEKLMVMK
jgi:hypothetical protein